LPIPEEILNGALPPGFDHMPPSRTLIAMLAGTTPDELDPATLENLSPRVHVHADAPPTLVMHGTCDAITHHEQSVRFADAASASGMQATLMLIDGANHEGPEFDAPDLLAHVASFIRQHG
jgi:dipeptidyl aminopeptidase/acylaminoacyl peptidase